MSELTITYAPATGPRRRVRFEAREDGYWRITERWCLDEWHVEGREAIDDLDLSAAVPVE